jgi:hypothetical protein
MTLLGSGPRDVAARFLAAQPHQQSLPDNHPVQRQAGADKGHWASLGCDVDLPITGQFLRAYKTQGFLPFYHPKRIAKRPRQVL